MNWLAKITRRAGGVGVVIGAGFLIGIVLLIVANIIYRFFGGVIAGTYELIELLVAVVAASAFVYVTLERGHVVINVIANRFPQRMRAIAESITLATGLGLWALVAWANVGLIREKALSGEETLLLNIPVFPFRLFWELSLILICLVLLVHLCKALSEVISK
jgi:TRAP-type C4-dicarboxylate transport system permease small subunit